MSITSQVIFMQELNQQNNKRKKVLFQELSFDERQKLVGAFVWLVEQDKKQNPALYQRKSEQNDRYSMSTNT